MFTLLLASLLASGGGGGWGSSWSYSWGCGSSCCCPPCCYPCCGWGCYGWPVAVASAPALAQASAAAPTRAAVVVELPEDAALHVNGRRMSLVSSTRRVLTPDLEPDREYAYVVTASYVRGGKTVEKSKRVAFRAGDVIRVNLDGARTAGATLDRDLYSLVTVRMPEDARLTIDGVAAPSKSGVCLFKTPALEPDQLYYYTLKMEVIRDGEERTETRRIDVEAGKRLEVDFRTAAPVSTARR